MHIEVIVEELSAEAALQNVLPRILPSEVSYKIHPHNGKPDLLYRLPGRLKGYRKWMPADYRIVVLIDSDRQACQALEKKLEEVASEAGFITKSKSKGGIFQVLNRVVMEELEAWFFGDPEALTAAYPRIPSSLFTGARYRNPDTIAGTAETLESILEHYRYFLSGMPKIQVARSVSAYMDPKRNRSKSFQVFRKGILDMLCEEAS